MNRQLKADFICVLAVLWWVVGCIATSASAQVGSQLWYNSGGVCAGVTPDPNGAISRSFTVHKANACISITARTDAALAILDAEPRCQGNMTGSTCLLTDNNYWNRTASYTDGHVYFDLVSQRWYIIELNEDTGHVQVGFSPGDNPLSMYVTDVIPPNGDFPDYPQLGFNSKWLALSVQLKGPDSSILYVWSKQDTFANGLSATPLITRLLQGENGYTLPCEGQNASFGGLWFVRSWGGWWNNSMQLSNITGPEGAPVFNEFAGTPHSNFSWHEFDRNSVSQQPFGAPPIPNGPKAMKAIQCIQQGGPSGNTLYFANTGEVPVAPNVLAANSALQPQVVEVDNSEGDGRTEGRVDSIMRLGTPPGQTDQKRAGDMMIAINSPGGLYNSPPIIESNDGLTRDYHQAVFDNGSTVSQAYDQLGDNLTASMSYSPFPSDPLFMQGANYVDVDTTGLQAGHEIAGTLITVRNMNQNPWFYSPANPVMHAAPNQPGIANSYVVALQDNTPNTVGLYALLGSPMEHNNPIFGCPDESSLDYINIGWNAGLQTPSVWLGDTQFPGSLADPALILQTPFNIPSGTNYLWAQQYLPSDSCFVSNQVFADANAGITIPLYAADLWATFFWQVPISNVNGTFNVGTYGAGYSASGDPNQGGFTTTTDPFIGVDNQGNQVIGFGRVAPWLDYGIAWAKVPAGALYPGVPAFQFVKGTLQAYNRTGDYCHGGWEPSAGLYWFCAAETSPSGVGWQIYGNWGI